MGGNVDIEKSFVYQVTTPSESPTITIRWRAFERDIEIQIVNPPLNDDVLSIYTAYVEATYERRETITTEAHTAAIVIAGDTIVNNDTALEAVFYFHRTNKETLGVIGTGGSGDSGVPIADISGTTTIGIPATSNKGNAVVINKGVVDSQSLRGIQSFGDRRFLGLLRAHDSHTEIFNINAEVNALNPRLGYLQT